MKENLEKILQDAARAVQPDEPDQKRQDADHIDQDDMSRKTPEVTNFI